MLVLRSRLKTSRKLKVLINIDFIACLCSVKANNNGANGDKKLSAQGQRALWASQWIQCIL